MKAVVWSFGVVSLFFSSLLMRILGDADETTAEKAILLAGSPGRLRFALASIITVRGVRVVELGEDGLGIEPMACRRSK